MRERALIHVAGPKEAGKTMFIESLLRAEVAFAICVRGEHDVKLLKEQASTPKAHGELRRYRESGASTVALYQFPAPDIEAFFTTDVMEGYSEVVYIEGDCPLEYVDLMVFVAPPLPQGKPLLRRVIRDHAARHQASIESFSNALERPESLVDFLHAKWGDPLVDMALGQPQMLDNLRELMKVKLEEIRRAPPPSPTEHWAIEEGYGGIERAQLVVVNVRDNASRAQAEVLVDEVVRLRKDAEVFRDVVGALGNKLPVTAVVADLADPKDAGTKKAVARIKRATRRTAL